ncbi:MAG: CocE/NonD family hydrolase [Candidatus Delongbacteria bacterium]|nr:CocE/NonD family hydrolase [Candidatus Delongbacteria bacterium]
MVSNSLRKGIPDRWSRLHHTRGLKLCLMIGWIVTGLMMVVEVSQVKADQAGFQYRKQTVMIPMRDSVKLATDLYKPLFGTQWPVILIRTPYNKNSFKLGSFEITGLLPSLLGVVVAIQDTRGRYESEGIDSVFLDSGWGIRQDGYDAIEWIAGQSWCNGRVCIMGPSAMGINTYLAAGALPPHLTCAVSIVAPSDLYSQAIYQGGCFREEMVDGWLEGINSEYMLPYIRQRPLRDSLWESVSFENRISQVTIPILHIGGWYDCFSQGNIRAFQQMCSRGGESGRDRQYLMMGPWVHQNTMSDGKTGEIQYPNINSYSQINFILDFITGYLNRDDPDLSSYPRISYYLMSPTNESGDGANDWMEADIWPPVTDSLLIYCHSEQRLQSSPPAGSAGSLSVSIDPFNPVPTIGGNNLNLNAGPYQQSSLDGRNDILTLQTPVLENKIIITGEVLFRCWFQCNRPDVDICVKLCDVYPDGRVFNILDGIAKGRYRQGVSEEHQLYPDSVYHMEISLWSTAYQFNPGHRIRLDISGNNYPRFRVNPHHGQGLFDSTQTALTANLEILCDTEHPSHLYLPAVPVPLTPVSEAVTPSHRDSLHLFSIYPNPAQSLIHIPYHWASSSPKTVQLKLYTVTGIIAKQCPDILSPGLHTITISTGDLPSGIYLIRIEGAETVHSCKVTVIH